MSMGYSYHYLLLWNKVIAEHYLGMVVKNKPFFYDIACGTVCGDLIYFGNAIVFITLFRKPMILLHKFKALWELDIASKLAV